MSTSADTGTTTITPAGIPELDDRLAKIAAMYQYERDKDIDAWADLWAEDASVRFPWDLDPSARTFVGKDAIVKWTADKFVDRASSEINANLEATAGAPKVIAHLNVLLHFADGHAIGGPLLIIFTFNGAGKVVLMEEFVSHAYFPPNYRELATPDPRAGEFSK